MRSACTTSHGRHHGPVTSGRESVPSKVCRNQDATELDCHHSGPSPASEGSTCHHAPWTRGPGVALRLAAPAGTGSGQAPGSPLLHGTHRTGVNCDGQPRWPACHNPCLFLQAAPPRHAAFLRGLGLTPPGERDSGLAPCVCHLHRHPTLDALPSAPLPSAPGSELAPRAEGCPASRWGTAPGSPAPLPRLPLSLPDPRSSLSPTRPLRERPHAWP